MKKIAFLSAAAMSIAFAVPAQAQWAGFTANNNGAEFWDNMSIDGATCNIGMVVTGVATAEACANERPDPWLPFTGTGYDRYNQTQTFTYFGGSVSIVQAPGQGGDIAGEDRNWGYWTSATNGGAKTNVNVNALGGGVFNLAGQWWGLWVNTTDGVTRYSDTDNQFARFARSTAPGCVTVVCGPIMVGIEDIYTPSGGDRDYQDMIASFSLVGVDTFDTPTVPEPSTYALMAAGLAALGVVARRRRNNA